MEVSEEIYAWLRSTGLFQLSSSNKSTLPQDLTNSLIIGQSFVPIIKRMNQLKVTASHNDDNEIPIQIQNLSSLKQIKTPAGLLQNWKIISEALEIFGIQIDQDDRTLIIAGETKPISNILRLVKEAEASGFSPKKQGVDINSFDIERSLREAESCLEFFILSFVHSFHLPSKQATGLLAQGCKYLAHIVAKGLKGDFEPVRSWLQELYVSNDKILTLISDDPSNIQFVLSVLKPGLLSKDLEVVQWTFRVLSRVILELTEKQHLGEIWSWFVSENISEICVFSVKRIGSEIFSHAVELLLQIGQYNFFDFFAVQTRNVFSENADYYEFICEVLDYVKDSQSSLEEINDSGIISFWTEVASKDSEYLVDLSKDSRASALVFLNKVLAVFLSYFERNESQMNALLGLLNRTCRDESKILKCLSVAVMFQVFEQLSENKSVFAPVIYRTLTFLLVETYNSSEIRQYIQANFCMVFKRNESIPISILIEPYLKRLQVNDVPLELFDYDFLNMISQFPSLSLKQAIQIIDLAGKSYLNDLVFAKISGVPFTNLASRFITQLPMQDYLFAFIEYGLNLTTETEAKKLKKGKKPADLEDLIQQRNNILDMVYWVIQQWQDSLNEKVKTLLIRLINEFKKSAGEEMKGLIILLDLLGEAEFLIQESRAKEAEEAAKEVKETIENYQITPITESVEVKKIKVGKFPWERINEDIERARRKKIDKDNKLREDEEKLQKNLDFKKKKLKQQLGFRKLEQGVQRNDLASLVYKEGVVQKYVTQEDIPLRVFSNEESDLEEGVRLMMSKYSRVFKLLFFTYSGTGFEKKNHAKTDFDLHAERKSKLNDAEYIKILKDFEVIPKLMNKEELKIIMRNYNLKIAKQAEQWYVDYKGFKGVFTQLAYFIYSRRPFDYSHLPPIVSLKSLIDHMRTALVKQGKSTEVFDEPDPGTGDKDFIKSLNAALMKDPKIPIPEGYVKITDKEVQVFFSVPEEAILPHPAKISVEILDDLLFKVLGIRFLEPQILQTVSYRVKGKPLKKEQKIQPPIYERASETSRPKAKGEKIEKNEKIEKVAKSERVVKVENSFEKQPNNVAKSTVSLKPEAKQDLKQEIKRDLKQEVKGKEDLRQNSKSNIKEEIRNNSKPNIKQDLKQDLKTLKPEPPKSLNVTPAKSSKFAAIQEEVEIIRKKERNENDRPRLEEDRKRNLRQQELLDDLRRAKEARQLMLREEDERRKNQEFIDGLKKKVAEEKMQKAKEEKKKMLEIWLKKKQEDTKAKEQEDHIKKKMSEEIQKFEEARKRNQQRLLEELKVRETKLLKAKEEESLRLKKIIKDKELKKKIGLQKYFENRIKEQSQQKDEKREYLSLINNNEIKKYIEKFNDQIGDVFAFYLMKMGSELSNETSINSNLFSKFCEDFSVNEIASKDQCLGVFNFLTKKKALAVVNYEEFTKSLILVSNIGKDKLDIEESGVKPLVKFLDYTEISLPLKELKKKLNKLKNSEGKNKKKRPLSLINASRNLGQKAEINKSEIDLNKSSQHSSRSSGSDY